MAKGEGGIVLPPGGGERIVSWGTEATIKTVGADTANAYAAVEFTLQPAPAPGPPPHIHPHTEAFYILEGNISFRVGDQSLRVSPGAFLLVPGGVAHSFANADRSRSRMLTLFSPPGFEAYFREVGELAKRGGPPDLDSVLTLARKYNMEVVAPSS